jgi:hypothetical protein
VFAFSLKIQRDETSRLVYLNREVFVMRKKQMKRKSEIATVWGVLVAALLPITNTFALSGMMPETGRKVRIEEEWKGYYCNYAKAAKIVIYTADQWKEIWEKAQTLRLPKPELPKIDFAKKMAIAVFMGHRSSGGYEIEIVNISKTEKEIVVEVREREPPPGSPRTMALTQPYHIVVFKRYPLPVRFQIWAEKILD